jgi:hypothetical protein
MKENDMRDTFEGRCLCGAVRFRAATRPKWVLWCHCESCRRHTGAPASVFVAFDDSAVTVTTGAITKYSSSPGVERGFCARCGSTLTCTNERRPNETHFHLGAFENLEGLEPTEEMFVGERLPWLRTEAASSSPA